MTITPPRVSNNPVQRQSGLPQSLLGEGVSRSVLVYTVK